MDKKIYAKFLDTVTKNALLAEGDTALVGLSGGADSVCLLLLLKELGEREFHGNFNIVAAHFNHGIRGDEAELDEAFCKELCEKLGVEFYAEKGDVPSFAAENKLSTEEAARALRYGFLTKIAAKKLAQIAVAHNINDRAETILHNIARGCSLEGLKGISHRKGIIIRPILDLTRAETEQVCKDAGVLYRTDSTNTDTAYTRNKIRNEVLPYLNEALGVDFSESLLRLSDLAFEDNEFVKRTAEAELASAVSMTVDGLVKIRRARFETLPPAIAKRVLRSALSAVVVGGNVPFKDNTNIDRKMTERLYEYIIRNSGGGYVEAAKGVVCAKRGDDFCLGAKDLLVGGAELVSDEVAIISNGYFEKTATYKTPNGTLYNVELSLVEGRTELKKAALDCRWSREMSVIFDGQKLLAAGGTVVIRGYREGDYFKPFGAEGGKPLRRFFTDAKIPVGERPEVVLVARESEIYHVVNYRRSDFASIHSESECGILIKITKIEE